jgi:ribonuclease HI
LKPGRDPHRLKSYRPICLTSLLCKSLERILVRKLGKNTLEEPDAYAYRRKRSPEEPLGALVAGIDEARASGKHTVAVFLDKSLAFDLVEPEICVRELTQQGNRLSGPEREDWFAMTRWIRCFLQGRRARCRLDDELWNWQPIGKGLPQGSVLGPWCWNRFSQKLSARLHGSQVRALGFADDYVIYASHADLAEARNLVKGALKEYEGWCEEFGMTPNPDKSVFTVFSPGKPAAMAHVDLILLGKKLQPDSAPKYLGIRIGHRLDFTEHARTMVKRARGKLSALRTLANHGWLRAADIRAFYLTCVQAQCMYGFGVWGSYVPKSVFREIDQVVYAAGRLILGQSLKAKLEAVAELAEIALAEETASRQAAALWTRAWTRGELDSFRGAVQRGSAKWVLKGYAEATAAGINSSKLELDFFPWHDEKCDVAEAIRAGKLSFGTDEPGPERVQDSHLQGSVTYIDGAVHRTSGSWAVVRYGEQAKAGEIDWATFEARRGTVDTRADSFVAEQTALLEALRWEVAARSAPGSRAPSIFCLWTDSLGNVLSLAAPTVRDPVQKETYRLIADLVRLGTEVQINWVRSHGHSTGNSLADLYAAEAMRAPGAFDDYKGTVLNHMVKTMLDKALQRAGSLRLDAAKARGSASSERMLQASRGGALPNPLILDRGAVPCSRKNEILFHQAVLGDLELAAHRSHKFKQGAADETDCEICLVCEEAGRGPRLHDTDHIIFDCCALSAARGRLEAEIKQEERRQHKETREREEHKCAERRLATEMNNAGSTRAKLDPPGEQRTPPKSKNPPHRLEIFFRHPLPVLKFLREAAGLEGETVLEQAGEAAGTGGSSAQGLQGANESRGATRDGAAPVDNTQDTCGPQIATGRFAIGGGTSMTVSRIEGNRERLPGFGDDNVVRPSDIAFLNQLARAGRPAKM